MMGGSEFHIFDNVPQSASSIFAAMALILQLYICDK
jgi:hypothetical protein